MSKLPIEIEKIKKTVNLSRFSDEVKITERTEYLISIVEKNKIWNKSIKISIDDLQKLRDKIDDLISTTTTAEILDLSINKGKLLDMHYETDELCKNCNYKLTHNCITCIFELQSPLERKLFLALKENSYLKFHTQYALNWRGENVSLEGKTYSNPKNNFKNVLTVVDFYLEKRGIKLCVYTDGHTYHERTEEQAQRDKRIDRKLQELGYKVLRYTGKDVNENVKSIVDDIKKWLL